MEHVAFWTFLILVSAYLLWRFYFTPSVKKISRLRYAAIFIDAAVLSLFSFVWIPSSLSKARETGFALMTQGNFDVIAVFALAVLSLVFFITDKPLLLRTAAVFNIAASVIFIGALLRLFPETYTLHFSDSAPIFIVLLLLAGNVAVLFLWHQLQLRERKRINIWGGKKTALGLTIFALVVFGYWIWSSQSGKAAVYHESVRYGYSASLPRYWIVDALQSNYPAESFKNPSGDVTIFIQRLPTPDDVDDETVRGAIREELEKNPYHTPEIFEERMWQGHPTYYAEGIYDDEEDKFRFFEYNVFLDDRSVFTIRVNVKVSAGDKYQTSIAHILNSLILQ